MKGECEWSREPPHRAECLVHTQWSLVDWAEYESCVDHVEDWWDQFSRTVVDGQELVDFWITWYDTSS